jgi:dethiobiotin synthetase
MQPLGIFVTSTDTGVGKTIVSAVIARLLLKRNIKVAVMKPVTSGCREVNGRLVSEDAELLAWSAGIPEVSDDMAPYRLRLPIAPAAAAANEGVDIDFRHILSSYARLADSHDFLIVEGAGGFMAPLTGRLLISDLIKYLSLPALVVARPDLGTVNHTLLTCFAAKKLGIDVRGLVINNYPESPGIVEESGRGLIDSIADVPLLAILPHTEGNSLESIVHNLAERLADRPETDLFLRRIGAIY